MSSQVVSQTQIRKVYRLKNRWYQWGMVVVMGILVVVFVFFHSLILAGISALLGLAEIGLAQFLYITTSPDGLKYSNMGLYSISSRWANVDHVGQVQLRWLGNVRCIILREPVAVGPLARLAWTLPKEQLGRTIPLTNNWNNVEELIQDIKHYAPHVTGM